MARAARKISATAKARAHAPALALALVLALVVAAVACGPSFQAIYEGDQRFEHCYAVDDNPTAALADKGKCWRDWMQNYTYGQTRDRVEYAAVRQRALSRVAMPTDEAMMAAAPGQIVSRNVATPAPTSAFAPPPKTLDEAAGRAATPAPSQAVALPAPAPAPSVVFLAPAASPEAGAPAAAAQPPPPAAGCQDECRRGWQSCGARAGDAPDAKSETPCAKSYRACMRGCFK